MKKSSSKFLKPAAIIVFGIVVLLAMIYTNALVFPNSNQSISPGEGDNNVAEEIVNPPEDNDPGKDEADYEVEDENEGLEGEDRDEEVDLGNDNNNTNEKDNEEAPSDDEATEGNSNSGGSNNGNTGGSIKNEDEKEEEPPAVAPPPVTPPSVTPPPVTPPASQTAMGETLNSYVLEAIKGYSGGNFPYLLNNDYQNYNGVTQNIYFKDKLLLRGNPNGNRASHCVGITFEVFFKAMVERNEKLGIEAYDFNGLTYDQLYDFVLTWYVASSNKNTHNLTVALERYGLGTRIHNFEDARPGDFIDFSRENYTGHTVVLINWIRDNGKIVGLKYWSSQQSTKGISYNEEYFNITKPNGEKYGNVIMDMVFIGRGSAVKDYK